MGNRTEYYREYYKQNKEKRDEYFRNYSKNVRYKNFKKINAYIDRAKMDLFTQKLNKNKTTITDFINKAIDEYLKD